MVRHSRLLASLAVACLAGCGLDAVGEIPTGAVDSGAGRGSDATKLSPGAEAGGREASADGKGARDTGAASHTDAQGGADSGHVDAGHADAAEVDAARPDASVMDASHADAVTTEAGHPDASHTDASHVDAGQTDAGHVDAGVDAGITYPATCAELSLPVGQKSATLYLNHSASTPWTAWCVTTASSSKSYLTLVPTVNVSTYPLGGCATLVTGKVTGATTVWSKVLFDPTTLLVDTSDLTFATSTGATFETSGNGSFTHQYNSMPFASARSCVPSTYATATVNLTGTSFKVDPAQIFHVQGASASGSGQTTGEVTTVTVEGYPAGNAPCSGDYYTETGGACLKLAYAP